MLHPLDRHLQCKKPDNQDRATAAGSRLVLFPAGITCLMSWIIGQDTQRDQNSAMKCIRGGSTEYLGGSPSFVASSRAALAKRVFQTQQSVRSFHLIP